jgi:hypothetical protein
VERINYKTLIMTRRKIPFYIITFYSAYLFFTKGIDKGIDNWRFYASLFGLLGFIILFILVKKWEKNSINQNQ